MKKPYTKPELERLLISSVEDILNLISQPGGVNGEVGDGEWEGTNPDLDDPWA